MNLFICTKSQRTRQLEFETRPVAMLSHNEVTMTSGLVYSVTCESNDEGHLNNLLVLLL